MVEENLLFPSKGRKQEAIPGERLVKTEIEALEGLEGEKKPGNFSVVCNTSHDDFAKCYREIQR